MRAPIRVLFALGILGLAGCFTETREWMKMDQKYKKQEFQRDYRECERGRSVDEACMRQRGWVPVSPSKAEAPRDMDPLSKGRGR